MANALNTFLVLARSGPDPIVGPIVGGGAAAVYAGSRAAGRRARLVRELPTSTCAGVFMGLNEMVGTIEVGEGDAPASVSPLAKERCVWWSYTIEEERRHTRQVTTTDSNGHKSTHTETYTEWHTIDSGSHSHETFRIRDETGTIQIRPEGAHITPIVAVSEIVDNRSGWGWLKFNNFSPFNSATGRIRQTENVLPVGQQLVVVGTARQREDIVAPEVAKSPDSKDFFMSVRPLEAIQASSSRWHWALVVLAALAALAAPILMGLSFEWPNYVGPIIGIAVIGVVGIIGWTISVYNTLVRVRTRAKAANGLLDIQLQRRHDLIPKLASVAEAAAAHEAAIQPHLAALRATAGAGDSDQTVSAGRNLIATIEAYPDLRAQPAFKAVMDQLVDSENRVAAARAYLVDARTIVADAAKKFPGVLLARRMVSSSEFEIRPLPERMVTPELDLTSQVHDKPVS